MTASPEPTAIAPARRQTKERRRQLVALSSRGIFEHGYEKFSLNALAAAAGLSVGGIYRYITTKSDLLVMVCEDIYGGLHDALAEEAGSASDSHQRLRSAFTLYLTVCDANRDQILLLYREYRHLPQEAQQRYKDRESRIAELFAELIAAGQRAGEFVDVDAATVAQDMVLLGHLPALKGWALGERTGDMLVQQQVELIMSALTPGTSPPLGRRAATTGGRRLSSTKKGTP